MQELHIHALQHTVTYGWLIPTTASADSQICSPKCNSVVPGCKYVASSLPLVNFFRFSARFCWVNVVSSIQGLGLLWKNSSKHHLTRGSSFDQITYGGSTKGVNYRCQWLGKSKMPRHSISNVYLYHIILNVSSLIHSWSQFCLTIQVSMSLRSHSRLRYILWSAMINNAWHVHGGSMVPEDRRAKQQTVL